VFVVEDVVFLFCPLFILVGLKAIVRKNNSFCYLVKLEINGTDIIVEMIN
jgi:hypothetical protein